MKQKRITIEKYNKILNEILAEDLPVHEKLIKLLEKAGQYAIIKRKVKK